MRSPNKFVSLLKRYLDKGVLFALWVAIYIYATGCAVNGDQSPFAALVGLLALASFVILIFALGLIISITTKSPIFIGCYVGALLCCLIILLVPESVQLATIGGIIGFSLDKISAKADYSTPSTVVDRMANAVAMTSDSIRNAGEEAGIPIKLMNTRKALWSGLLTILTMLVVARAAVSIGIDGQKIIEMFS